MNINEEIRWLLAGSEHSEHISADDMNDFYFHNPQSALTLRSVEQHLKGCEVCRGRLRRFEEVFLDRVEPKRGSFNCS